MAYNFRPESVEDIKNLKYNKVTTDKFIDIWQKISKATGTTECITLDIKSKKCKILRKHKQKIDLKFYRSEFTGFITDFGDGSSPKNASSYGKALADAGELGTVQSLLRPVTTPTESKQKLFIDNPNFFDAWRLTFEHTKPAVEKIIKGNISQYDILHDATDKSPFAKIISDFTRKVGTAKDSWNPADIFLIKRSKRKDVIDRLRAIVDHDMERKKLLSVFNSEIYKLYKLAWLYPISLKQLSKYPAKIEYTNEPKKGTPRIDDVEIKSLKLDFSFKTKSIGLMNFTNKETGKTITMQVRGFPAGYNLAQAEMTSDGSKTGGRVGKIPTKVIDNIFGDYGTSRIRSIDYFGRAAKGWFSEFDKSKMKTASGEFKTSVAHPRVQKEGDIMNPDRFFDQQSSIAKDDLDTAEKMAMKIQGMRFVHLFVKNKKNLKFIVNDMINGAKKISSDNGFFIKVY